MNKPPESLPDVLPVFPLTGVLVFPGMLLPLHVFEPRYRHLVDDALSADGVFGMIQPVVPRQDNIPPPGSERENPDLYRVGCAGYIEEWQKLADGRYFIELRGMNRFRSLEELSLRQGYRRVKAKYDDFADLPLDKAWRCDRGRLIKAVEAYARAHGMVSRLDRLGRFEGIELINMLAMALPFHPTEKQALLEARSLEDRERVLLDLLRLGSGHLDPEPTVPPRTLH